MDTRRKVEAYLDAVGELLVSTLVTMENVRVIQYGQTKHEFDI